MSESAAAWDDGEQEQAAMDRFSELVKSVFSRAEGHEQDH